MLNFKKNKIATIGETLTWIVATFVIIAILAVFVIGAMGMSKLKDVSSILVSDSSSDFKEESQILTTKTSLAYELNNENKKIIEEAINEK